MVARKPFFGPAPHHPELDRLLEQASKTEITDAQIREQRISFAYGNAPEGASGLIPTFGTLGFVQR